MNNLKTILLLVMATFNLCQIEAANIKEQYWAYLGQFGVEYQKNEDYSKYVGKDVMYIREPTVDFETTPSAPAFAISEIEGISNDCSSPPSGVANSKRGSSFFTIHLSYLSAYLE